MATDSILINSDISLQAALGDLRELYEQHKYIKLSVRTGKDRSKSQNDITHVWYEQIARELKEDSALGWKSYCKLHHGVPIMRMDAEFREAYDAAIKPLSYEKKLAVMKIMPVTSLMTKAQISEYAEAVQEDFLRRGVRLEFPEQ